VDQKNLSQSIAVLANNIIGRTGCHNKKNGAAGKFLLRSPEITRYGILRANIRNPPWRLEPEAPNFHSRISTILTFFPDFTLIPGRNGP